MPQCKKNIFGFGKKVTYHRDVAKERRELKREAMAERRERIARKKLDAAERLADAKIAAADRKLAAAEKKSDRGGMTDAQFEATRAKLQREIEKQEKHKSLATAMFDEVRAYGKNPAESGRQYRLAQAVLSGTARVKGMTKSVAQEIVDRTPKKLRSLFSRNPEDGAAALSEAWNGRPAKTATDVIDKVHYHGVLTDLGRLKEITVMVTARKGQKIFFDAETRLCSSENGKQLYVVGGDQSLDLGALGIDGEEAEKDCVVVGEVHSIVYVTAKFHLGKADMEIGPYEHKTGEGGGVMPILIYDTLNQEVGFAGGSYFIDPTDYDGSHSAGIRN